MKKTKIIIGTRGSALARVQTNIVQEKLRAAHSDLEVFITVIKTEGDTNMQSIPLDTVGKGWFTKELEQALRKGTIDCAVHSLKDVPEMLPDGLMIGAITEREDARDVLVSAQNLSLEKLPHGAVIGTDSLRRAAQILYKRPDVVVKSVRGNVPTRISKLHQGEYDALVLAAAGLIRLGRQEEITHYFAVDDMVPAPGQGALAVEIREDDTVLQKLLEPISHLPTKTAVTAERVFSSEIGGGCKMPVGAYGICEDEHLRLYGMVGEPDGSTVVKDMVEGSLHNAVEVGKNLAARIAQQCDKEFLRRLRR